jgi:CheY-like chemotaxis protein
LETTEPARTETILIVDDERVIRVVVRNILQKHGYTVLEAANGTEAMALLESGDQAVDLVVTDMVMPGMTGVELIQRIETADLAIPVIYISGYMSDSMVREATSGGDKWVLAKPFVPATLMAAVQGALAVAIPRQVIEARGH